MKKIVRNIFLLAMGAVVPMTGYGQTAEEADGDTIVAK